MHRLRRSRILASLLLAWFTLVLGVGVAAPVMDPAFAGWICSASASAPAADDASGQPGAPGTGHGLQCPLCGTASAPPPIAPPVLGIVADALPQLPAPLALPPATDPAAPPAARGPPGPASF